MTHIARDYNMTDTGIRKYCKRHDIPTPVAGHWAKIAHGKSVKQKPLPIKDRAADEPIHFMGVGSHSVEIQQVTQESKAKQEQIQNALIVPDELPRRPHAVVRAVRAALRGIKADDHGFIELKDATVPEITIGKASIPRVLLLLQTLFTYAEKIGHTFVTNQRGFCWVVNGEPFPFRIYEGKTQEPHKPTRDDLQKQAGHDRWSDDGKQIYRKWDNVPSGKLVAFLRDSNAYGWSERDQALTKRWKDRQSDTLETFLAEIFIWLEPASVMARERRLVREEESRIAFEKSERERLIRERLVVAKKLRKYLNELSDIYAQANKIGELIVFFIKQKHPDSTFMQRVIDEANAYQEHLHRRLSETTISADTKNIEIDFDDDAKLYMLVLAMPELRAWDYRGI